MSNQGFGIEFKITQSMESKIYEALANILSELSFVKIVNYEKIRLNLGEFAEHEIPAIQFYTGGSTYTHEQSRLNTQMLIDVELILKSSTAGVVDQKELFEKTYAIERKIGANVYLNLDNSGMIHLIYNSTTYDLHSFEPFFISRMSFTALFYKGYTRDSC